MSPVGDADGFAAEDEDQGDATSDGPATASVIASKRVLDDDVVDDDDDDDGDALTSLGVSEAFAKRRRLGMRDDYDDDDRESRVDGGDDAGRTGDEGGGAARSGDADDRGESGEGSRKCGDHPRAEADDAATAAAVVVVLPFSSYRIVTPSSLDGSFELMRFRPSKDRTIALEECDGNHPPPSTSTAPPNGGIFSLTTIEAVKAALESCGDRGRNDHSLDVDSIVRAFEGGMLEVVVLRRATTPPDHRGSSSDGVGDVGVVSVRLALDGPRAGGDGIGESPGGGGDLLLRALGGALRGSIFDDVARSLPSSHGVDRRQWGVGRGRADDDSRRVVTARMVYGVVDNVRYSGEFDDVVDDRIGTTNGRPSTSLDVPGLVPNLRPYQAAAVRWMLERERRVVDANDDDDDDAGDEWELCWFVLIERPDVASTSSSSLTGEGGDGGRDALVRCNSMPLPEWKGLKSSPDERRVFCNPFSGWLAGTYHEARCMMLGNEDNGRVVTGGILAESMGLGKTVEVIACILANPSPLSSHASSAPRGQAQVESAAGADAVDESICSSSDQVVTSHCGRVSSNQLVATPSAPHDAICICGRSASFVGCLSSVVCEACGGGMHGRCAGFESEEELVSKTRNDPASGVRMCPRDHCATCVAAAISQSDGASTIESRATLIVTPPAILVQWQKEISRHARVPNTGRSLKVVVYPGVRELCRAGTSSPHEDFHLIHPRHLANADVVLLTFQTLMSELGHSDENPFAGFAKGRSCLRNKKRYVVLPSPLTSVKWWRVCLDEAQRVEVPTAASARMARKLITDKRWCVSGTPIGRGRLDDLYGLLLFLSVKPFDEKRWFANSFVLSHGNALGRLSHLMKNIMWRSTKENKFVRQQMGIPDQEEKRVILQFSFVEQFFYDRQFDITSKAVHSWTEAKGPNWLSHSLQRLRAACCHPQVGTSGIGDRVRSQHGSNASTVLSMDEILEKLIDDAKAKCEEAQRIAILHTIGLAGLTNLKVGEFVSSRRIYEEALDIADSNASPAEVIGKAILKGSAGFCSNEKTIYNGSSKLDWRISDKSPGEVWVNVDFVSAPRKISFLKLRHILPSELQGVDAERCTILRPKECILQMSSAAAGGGFLNVRSFTLSDDAEVQVVTGFIAKKSKSWRIRVKSFHGNLALAVTPELKPHCFYVGINVRLFEPEIADDHLQRLHILHNMSIVLSALVATDGDEAKDTTTARLKEMVIEERIILNNYMAHAKAGHCQSKQQLLSAVKIREKCENEMSDLSEGSDRPWYEDVLDWVNLYGNDQDRQNLCETVKYALTNYMDTQSGASIKVDDRSGVLIRRGNFPHFNSVDGLHSALAIRIQQGENEVGLRKGLNKKKCVLQTVMNLSSTPADGEIYMNSHCRRCRRDWDQRGPICSHCHLEDDLVKVQQLSNDLEITCVLKALSKFAKDHLAKTGSQRDHYLGIIGERSSKYFVLEDKIRDEISAAKSVWKAHFDLLSDIDELNQCKRAMRLKRDGEVVSSLTKNEAAFIIDPHNLPIEIMEHEVKQASALGMLRRNKSTLRYLKNQRTIEADEIDDGIETDRPSTATTATATATTAETCCICLAIFGDDRSVLPCGHSFHPTCLDRLFNRFGKASIRCPMRCEMMVSRAEVLQASNKNSKVRSNISREIKGDWGTKVNRLMKDVVDAVRAGDKSVIFSQWDEMMNIVAEALGVNQIFFIRPQSGKRFGEDVKRFRSSDCPVLVMNVKNGAEGLTLTEANHVFMLEPILNYGLDAQAINRIHRIGQLKKTYVHRYIVQNTIEERIDAIRVERQEMQFEDDLQDNRKHSIKGGGIDGGFDPSELNRLFVK